MGIISGYYNQKLIRGLCRYIGEWTSLVPLRLLVPIKVYGSLPRISFPCNLPCIETPGKLLASRIRLSPACLFLQIKKLENLPLIWTLWMVCDLYPTSHFAFESPWHCWCYRRIQFKSKQNFIFSTLIWTNFDLVCYLRWNCKPSWLYICHILRMYIAWSQCT